MEKKTNTARIVMIVVVILLAVVLAVMVRGALQFRDSHVFVGGHAYAKDLKTLDLRDRALTEEEYIAIDGQLPDCEILWNVPFSGGAVSCDSRELRLVDLSGSNLRLLSYLPRLERVDATACQDMAAVMALKEAHPELAVDYQVMVDGQFWPWDTAKLTVSRLTEADIAQIAYLPELREVDAGSCQDYDQLLALQQSFPEVTVSYSIEVLGTQYPNTTTELTFSDPDIAQLKEKLPHLTQLKTVSIPTTNASAEELLSLKEALPGVSVVWEKDILGQHHSSEDTEFDFTGMTLTLEQVEEEMRYFPNAEKVLLIDCGFDNETLAAFREKMRPDYKVVWTVTVTGQKVRTDDTIFHSSGRGISLVDELSYDLYYCEDMIVVDIGHSQVKYVEWVKGMPNLKYLILADNWIKDITPLSTCKNLVYLELFINKWFVGDLTPLLGCTSLEDVSISDTTMDPTPLAEMTWLKNLWCFNDPKVTSEVAAMLQESLPNTRIEYGQFFTTGKGWRQLQNYYDMRDLMGLPYNRW